MFSNAYWRSFEAPVELNASGARCRVEEMTGVLSGHVKPAKQTSSLPATADPASPASFISSSCSFGQAVLRKDFYQRILKVLLL